ncbi:MAG: M23 family metallopeptidase [Candidatus Cloacimonetes bacterium]|nr:M23 family metallopeptidase [Candidatus Cloacimonadota bacterium]
MSIRKSWYISLMQADSSRTYSLRISKTAGYIILLIFLTSIFVFSFYARNVWRKNTELIQLSKLQRENDALRDRMSNFSTQVDSLLIKIRIMEDWEDTIRQERRLPVINPDVRALGSGGTPFSDPVFLPFCEELDRLYNDNLVRLNYISAKTELTFATHFDLLSTIQSRESLYRATPSIWPTFGRITSLFGYRLHPITHTRTLHAGIDIANDRGTIVYSTADGTVTFAGRSGTAGNLIRIDHASGLQTRYAHLDRIFVQAGDTIYKGQIIGAMGSSGNSTGYHLHYEVMDLRRGRLQNPVAFLGVPEDQLPTDNSLDITLTFEDLDFDIVNYEMGIGGW